MYVGPNRVGLSEGKVLTRIVRWDEAGWQVEADPRHGEVVIEHLGWIGGRGLSAPGNGEDERGVD